LFTNTSPCIRTHNDKELIDFNKFKSIFNQKYLFKAFDFRYVDFDLSKIGRARIKIMNEFLNHENIGFIFQRGSSSDIPNTPFLTNCISDQGAIKPGTTSTSTVAPLYLYPETITQQTIDQTTVRTPNLNTEIVNQIAEKLGLKFTNEKEAKENTFAPIDILDYIYAVLHSPTYREKYKEFLKIDFPRVPYPKDKETFWQLVKLGGEIRQIHLLESSTVEKYITQYPIDGTNEVSKPKYENGKVYINETQYFDNVPEVAWNFFIGGYQPAQKWLKDRKERTLEFEDILHYQKIIVALTETDRLMKEIDKIEIE
jgi:predicted helicase